MKLFKKKEKEKISKYVLTVNGKYVYSNSDKMIVDLTNDITKANKYYDYEFSLIAKDIVQREFTHDSVFIKIIEED